MKSVHFILFSILVIVQTAVYQQRYQEALAIAKAMTLDQKIGQVLQVDFGAFSSDNKTD